MVGNMRERIEAVAGEGKYAIEINGERVKDLDGFEFEGEQALVVIKKNVTESQEFAAAFK